jgi:hypothetical protein
VDKNYLIKLWAAEKETLLRHATDKANTVLGWKAQSSLEEAMASLEMGTESEKSRNNNNEKCAVLRSYFNSLVQKL